MIELIKERVLKGGHFVPDEDVRRRYYRSKRNFWNTYRKLADRWYLVFNSEDNFQKFTIGEAENYVVSNQTYFQLFTKDLPIAQ